MNSNSNPVALFVADTHFHLVYDQTERYRIDRFVQFLDVTHRADHLILLGDIFDFWFDFPHFRLKGYETILQALDRVRDAGTVIHFIGGNHDIWAADYMHVRYGCAPQAGPFVLHLGHQRVQLTHGDGLLSHDWSYSSFRALVRNPLGIALAKSLHPELLYAFCKWLSSRSRVANREEAEQIAAKAVKYLQAQADADWDLMVIGHIHHPFSVEHSGRTLAGLGGWLERESYGIFVDGQFHLQEFSIEQPFPV